jgi:hypothetical protein
MADTPITTPEEAMSRPLLALVVFVVAVLALGVIAVAINAARSV